MLRLNWCSGVCTPHIVYRGCPPTTPVEGRADAKGGCEGRMRRADANGGREMWMHYFFIRQPRILQHSPIASA